MPKKLRATQPIIIIPMRGGIEIDLHGGFILIAGKHSFFATCNPPSSEIKKPPIMAENTTSVIAATDRPMEYSTSVELVVDSNRRRADNSSCSYCIIIYIFKKGKYLFCILIYY